VVGHGIDTELFNPDGMPPEDPPLVLCVGRFSPVKDHPTLLKAAALLKERINEPFRVLILGGPGRPEDEAYIAQLRRMVEELGIQEQIRFHPTVSMSELPSWYQHCTVHVNLTPTGCGDKVAWEAMACGRPCVAANKGFQETFGRYAENLLFELGDAKSLAERLLWVLSLEKGERNAIGTYLRGQVLKLHSLDRLCEELVKLFEPLHTPC